VNTKLWNVFLQLDEVCAQDLSISVSQSVSKESIKSIADRENQKCDFNENQFFHGGVLKARLG